MKNILILGMIIASPIRLLSYTTPYVLFPKDYVDTTNSEIAIKNMPPIRSQDGLGICYSFAAATLLEQKLCTINKINCKNISNDQRLSPIELAKYTSIRPDDVKSVEDPSINQIKDSGNVDFIVKNCTGIFESAVKESCAPFDKIVEKYGSDNTLAEQAWLDLEKKYNDYKKKTPDCVSCYAKYVSDQFSLNTPNDQVLRAFGEETFSKFLYKLLIPEKCNSADQKIKIENMDSYSFPQTDLAAGHNYTSFIKEIKNNLIENRPTSAGICAKPVVPDKIEDCKEFHYLVITGYKKLCNQKGVCHEALKVHNSYGQKWQDENNDGWVMAEELLNRTKYATKALTWIM